MKPGKRINTNQTNNSNKKSSHSPRDNASFQLPKVISPQTQIQKTSNYDTHSNLSYDLDFNDDKEARYQLEQIEENQKQDLGLVNYQKMTMEEIKLEYQRLRDEMSTLSAQVKKKNQLLQSKVTKKQQSRISNPVQTERKLAQTQQQVYQNSQHLQRLRQEYEQLQKRSNLANSSISRPNAQMNNKILTLRQKVMTVKEKIKTLKRKTKKTGDDIVNGQNIHEVLEKLERQQKALESRQANLQAKIDGSRYKIERQDQKLDQIQKAYSNAQDYLKLFKLQSEEIEQKNSLSNEWRQRIHRQQVVRKKIQSDQQTNLQKYHQLLKLFETQSQKEEKLNKKLIDEDIKILKARNTVLDLQRQLEDLQEILQKFNDQQNLKKEADLLRRAMEANNTFMTENGFAMTSNSLNSHLVGVKSIIEENESEIRNTIENVSSKDMQTIEKSGSSKLHVKTKDRLLLTKAQEKRNSISKRQNKGNLTGKLITQEQMSFADSKYFLSSKEISRKRQEQKNKSSLRKQSSTNESKNGRKIYSLMKTNEATKLNQISMNRTANKEIKIPKIRESKKESEALPQTAKHPYISLNKNGHEKDIEKGKQILRERKGSFKRVQESQNQSQYDVKKSLLNELEQINRQLKNNQGTKDYDECEDQIDKPKLETMDQMATLQKTKPLYDKQRAVEDCKPQQLNRVELSGKIVKPSSKEGRVLKPSSKQGKIRNQSIAIKPEILSEIDRRNVEYSKKIQEIKQQLISKSKDAESNKQTRPQSALKIQEAQQSIQAVKTSIQSHGITTLRIASQNFEPEQVQEKCKTQSKKQPKPQDGLNSDQGDDIEEDISQINQMIRKKLQAELVGIQ